MPIDPFNQRIADEARHRQNKGRMAHAHARFKTVGNGTFEFDARIEFGLTFIERPFVSCGWQIDEDSDDSESYPHATGFVTNWDTTEREHYVGCWVAVTVSPPYLGQDITEFPEYRVWHDFTFSGIALKDIPYDL